MPLYKLTLDPIPSYADYEDSFAFKDAGNSAVDLTGFGSQWVLGIGKGRATTRSDYAVLLTQANKDLIISNPVTGIIKVQYTPEKLAPLTPDNDYQIDLWYTKNNRKGAWGYGTIRLLGPGGG